MPIRLNGWQRIGVVISAAWVLFVGGWGTLEYVYEGEPTYYFVDTVRVDLPPTKDVERPRRTLSLEEFAGYRAERHFRPSRLFLAMLLPVVLLWVFAYVFIFVTRWIAAGFRNDGT